MRLRPGDGFPHIDEIVFYIVTFRCNLARLFQAPQRVFTVASLKIGHAKRVEDIRMVRRKTQQGLEIFNRKHIVAALKRRQRILFDLIGGRYGTTPSRQKIAVRRHCYSLKKSRESLLAYG